MISSFPNGNGREIMKAAINGALALGFAYFASGKR
jgi:hypothetical protein